MNDHYQEELVQVGAARSGVLLAVVSATTFGTSGVFASALLDAGWSPVAAVTARIAVAALVLTVPALLALRGRWRLLLGSARLVGVYGVVAVAGCQLCYFNALRHLSVGVALLLEYLGSVLVVGWVWLRHGARPRPLTAVGALAAVGGLVLVLDVAGGARIDVVGLAWGVAAAVCLAVYFVVSARTHDPLPPAVTVWGGMVVAAALLAFVGAVGILPVAVRAGDVELAGRSAPWWLPVLGLAVVAGAVAYLAGIGAARRLGATAASFLGLLEVVVAVVLAWWWLDEALSALQVAGAVLVVGGAALVRWQELRAGPPAEREPVGAGAGFMAA